jgi:hypothetical protein
MSNDDPIRDAAVWEVLESAVDKVLDRTVDTASMRSATGSTSTPIGSGSGRRIEHSDDG